jgi:hypothetical protein
MFDYDAPNVPDTAVADVVASIVNSGKPPPLSDEERETRRLQNEMYRWECDQRREQRRIEQRIKQEALEAEQEAIAREQAQIEQAEANRKARLERQQRDLEHKRDQRLGSLEIRAKQGEIFQNHVETSARNAVFVRNQAALLADVENFLTPPAPPPEPEPEVVYVEQPAENTGRLPKLDYPKLRSWYFD